MRGGETPAGVGTGSLRPRGRGRGGLPATVAVARLSNRSVESAAWGMTARRRERAGGGACRACGALSSAATPPTRGGGVEARVAELGSPESQAAGALQAPTSLF